MLAGEPPFTGPTAQADDRPQDDRSAAHRDRRRDRSLAAARALLDACWPSRRPTARVGTRGGEDARRALGARHDRRDARGAARRRGGRALIGAAVVSSSRRHCPSLGRSRADASTGYRYRRAPVRERRRHRRGVFRRRRDRRGAEPACRAIPGLQVTARASTGNIKGREDDEGHRSRARRDYILTGTVRWSKAPGRDRVRVTPELIDVSNAATRWSEPFDTVMSDVFTVQANIASRVAERMHVALADKAQQIARRRRRRTSTPMTNSSRASRSRTRGIGDRRSDGARHYERAVALDTTFLQAWSSLARAPRTSTVGADRGGRRARPRRRRACAAARAQPVRGSPRNGVVPARREARLRWGAPITRPASSATRTTPTARRLATVSRILGRFDDALTYAQQAFKFDPRSVSTARRVARRSTTCAASPRNCPPGIARWRSRRRTSVSFREGVRLLVARHARQRPRAGRAKAHDGRHDGVARTLRAISGDDVDAAAGALAEDRQAHRADFGNDRGHWGLKVGHTYLLMGDTVRGRMFGDSARAAFEAQLQDFPRTCAASRAAAPRARARRAPGAKRSQKPTVAQASRDVARCVHSAVRALPGRARPHSVGRLPARARPDGAADDEPRRDMTPAYLQLDPTFKPLYGNERFSG